MDLNSYRLILGELAHRRLNFALSVFGVTVASALFVFSKTTIEASSAETARIQRDLGLNLNIIPAATDMNHYLLSGFSDVTMPEQYVHEMASQTGLDYAHLLPRLGRVIEWSGKQVALVGVLPEISPVDQKKPSMSYAPKQGTVGLGFQVAAAGLDGKSEAIKQGDAIEVMGKSFTVADVFQEMGTQEDISIKAHLRDVQSLLELPGRIGEIQAINCTCFELRGDLLEQLREQLKPVLPEAKVVLMRKAAEARDKQRHMVEDYLSMVMPVVLVLCAAWVGLLAWMNVRERRQEIGILRAIGFDSGRIVMLFQGKAVLGGLVGAGLGFAVGTGVAMVWGPDVFRMTAGKIKPGWVMLAWLLPAASVFAALASLLPTMMAVTHDPAVTLREQ